MNLANKITLSRILAIPIIVILLQFPDKFLCLISAVIFVLASLSDLLDGYVARREKTVTNFGIFLDPLADKLLIGSVLIMLTELGWVAGWISLVIIGRELIVTGLRAMAAEKNIIIAADRFGKIKTVMQVIALIPLILHYSWFGLNPVLLGLPLLYIALVLTVFSGVRYLYIFWTEWSGNLS